MNAALIATVFNEAGSIDPWLESVRAQTRLPDEIVIVDGGSTDGTPSHISDFFSKDPRLAGRGKVLQRRCNISEGRNLAIETATCDVIVCSDAGSILDPAWFERMTEPFAGGAELVAGWTSSRPQNAFQEKLSCYSEKDLAGLKPEDYQPSSRTIAFRKSVWRAVGGYPEWMTLAGEDALFNANLKAAGFKFVLQKDAVVYWDPSPTMSGFMKQIYSYGYGAAEAKLYSPIYLRWMLTTFLPPLILFSANPIRDVAFRYLRNAASTFGWLAGKLGGRKPPAGWKIVEGVLLSPQTQSFRHANRIEVSAATT